MNSVLLWILAMRAPFFTASGMSVVVGSAAAWHFGAPCDWLAFAVTLVGVVALHAAGNLSNDYYDHLSGDDEANRWFGPFSGGSRAIQEMGVAPKRVLAAAVAGFAVATVCAAYCWITRGGWQIPALALAGGGAAFLYTAPPARLAYVGFGETAIFAAFGPLLTMGAYFVQARHIDAAAFWCGVPVGLLVALILIVNEFPDFEADSSVGKNHLVVRLGLKRAILLCVAGYVAAYGSIVLLVTRGLAPRAAYATLATVPMAAFVIVWLVRNSGAPLRLRVSSGVHILLHLLFAAILAGAYFFSAR
jgi:1,4-dihydroxy-2-naphthoate polyprenyltransferase